MSHTQIRVLAAAVVVLLVGGVTVIASRNSVPEASVPQEASSETASSTSTGSESEESEPRPLPVYADATSSTTVAVAMKAAVAPATATLVVGGTEYALRAAPGSTLEEALDLLETEGSFSYEAADFGGLGAFVTEVNGSVGSTGQYWILFVNGKKSATGISSTRIRSGDLIEWKLEQSY